MTTMIRDFPPSATTKLFFCHLRSYFKTSLILKVRIPCQHGLLRQSRRGMSLGFQTLTELWLTACRFTPVSLTSLATMCPEINRKAGTSTGTSIFRTATFHDRFYTNSAIFTSFQPQLMPPFLNNSME